MYMSGEKQYTDKSWLYRARVEQRRTLQDIGNEFGITRQAISLHCKRLGIPDRPGPPVPSGYGTIQIFVSERLALGFNVSEMARETGLSGSYLAPIARATGIDSKAARFWTHVIQGQDDECWEWDGSRMPEGYGRLWYKGECTYAHRVAWALTNGPIPQGARVCHTCGNAGCCNPSHMRLTSAAEKEMMNDR